MPYSAPGPFLGAQTAAAYQVSRSLRFRSSASAYLSRTFGTPTSSTTWTWSGWVKRGQIAQLNFRLFSNNVTTDDAIRFDGNTAGSANTLRIYFNGATSGDCQTSAVFRDPSAWYHVVVAVDTTQATSSNRVKIYVNGNLQTLGTSSYPALNYATNLNSAGSKDIGRSVTYAEYFDGYLAEVNFIDGQALTPSSFGQSNALTGVWEPKAYVPTGTGYGANGFYLPFSSNTSAETLAYDFSNTNSELISNGMFVSNVTGWTATGLGSPSVTWQSNHTMRLANSANNASWAYTTISTVIGQTYYAQAYISAASIGGTSRSIVLKKADDANYSINSVDVASTTQGSAPVGLQGTFTATATTTYIIIFADILGTGTTGVDVSQISTALGAYKKNWNPFNISTTSGTTYDSMIDSPTNYADGGNGRGNYAVLNPNFQGSSSYISRGNLYATGSNPFARATMSVPATGQYYYEVYVTAAAAGGYLYGGSGALYKQDGTRWNGSGWSAYGASYTAGDTIGCAVDTTNNTVTWYKNNASQGQITTNVGLIRDGISDIWGFDGSGTWTLDFNFGQRPFTYTPPSGFSALNTQNLPAPALTPSP